MKQELIQQAAEIIGNAEHLVAFTGAGISAESGIPTFRGDDGIWQHYDPRVLELGYFYAEPGESWKAIREIFYKNFQEAAPNPAHYLLAALEEEGRLRCLITQNIDDLHHRAGSRELVEYHGSCRRLVCTRTGQTIPAGKEYLMSLGEDELPPLSPEGGTYKPDFVFFGEAIPINAAQRSEREAELCDVMLIIGSTGEVYPAAAIPQLARQNGATIIEINPAASEFTARTTNLHIPMKAGEAAPLLASKLGLKL